MLFNKPRKNLFFNNGFLAICFISMFLVLAVYYRPLVNKLEALLDTHNEILLQQEENIEVHEKIYAAYEAVFELIKFHLTTLMKGLAVLSFIALTNIYYTRKVRNKEDDFELAKSLGFSLVKKNSLLGKILPPTMSLSDMTDKPVNRNEFRKAIERLNDEHNFRIISDSNDECLLKVPGRTIIFSRQSKTKQIFMNSLKSKIRCTLLESGCVSIESFTRFSISSGSYQYLTEAACETLRHRLELTKKVFQEIV